MGTMDSKQIQMVIDDKYRPIRKYFDNLYGQITVIQHKKNGRLFALHQKHLQGLSKREKEYIQARARNKDKKSIYLPIVSYYSHYIDLCSSTEMYYILTPYINHTMYAEIASRQQNSNYFTLREFTDIVHTYISFLQEYIILKQQYQHHQFQKMLVSGNHSVSYEDGKLRCLQPLFKSQEVNTNRYYAPEARECQLSTQAQIIFSLGMNLLEIALLADVSEVYAYSGRTDFKKLREICRDVKEIYGETIYAVISRMLREVPQERGTAKQCLYKLMQ